jgi:hypothetical protein
VPFFKKLVEGLFILQPRLCLPTKTLSICPGTSTDITPEFEGSNNPYAETDGTRHRRKLCCLCSIQREVLELFLFAKALSDVVYLNMLEEFFTQILEEEIIDYS